MGLNRIVTAQPTKTLLLSDSRIDFVLVTALAEERDAVLRKLLGYRKLPPSELDTHTYYRAEVPVAFPDSTIGTYQVIVMPVVGMGRVKAATATTTAISRWCPRYVVLVGIARGVAAQGVRIGDILIADQVVDYELQKLTPQGPQIRWEVHRADVRLLNACDNFTDRNWTRQVQTKRPDRNNPGCHVGPIASGDKVIAFNDVLARYCEVWPKLIGVEMEAAGVAAATVESPEKPGFFMVRCASDLADENKGSANVEKWRYYACDAAASFAIALLRSGPVHLSDGVVKVKTKQVQLIIEGEFSNFSLERQQYIVGALAALLETDPGNIKVLQVYQGSIRIRMEIPESAADRLYTLAAAQDAGILNLGIKSVLVEDREVVELPDKTGVIPGLRPEQSQRILVVEDDGRWRNAYKRTLETHGHAVTLAADYETALVELESSFYQVVVVDVRLIGDWDSEGLRLIGEIDRLHSSDSIHKIIVSGYPLNPDEIQRLVETVQSGSVSFLSKGGGPNKLIEELQRISPPVRYNMATVRNLIRDAFTDKELRRFCQDRPLFEPVLGLSSSSSSLEDTIDVLIEYCQKRLLFGELLQELQEYNPAQYARYQDKLHDRGKTLEIPEGETRQLQKRVEKMNAKKTEAEKARDLVDGLVDMLDLLRHNARNVLVERWEKRNLGQVVTPPVFDDKPHTKEELYSLFPREDEVLGKLASYQKADGSVAVVSAQHIKSLKDQMISAQKSVDRYSVELSKPLSASERIVLEHQKDEYQGRLDRVVEELADILAFLYSG